MSATPYRLRLIKSSRRNSILVPEGVAFAPACMQIDLTSGCTGEMQKAMLVVHVLLDIIIDCKTTPYETYPFRDSFIVLDDSKSWSSSSSICIASWYQLALTTILLSINFSFPSLDSPSERALRWLHLIRLS